MNHGSLFSGIGGFDLASQWCGWNNVFQVEIDGFCQKLLKKNFPNVERYKDIHEFNGTKYRGAIDVVSGGFPCQPFSVAGKQKGKEDDRYLWPEMLRVIQEIKPTWVVGENVAGIISMGLNEVLSDLESVGYEVQPLVIPACAVNAPHRRDRVWIVAYNDSTRSNRNEEHKVCSGRNADQSPINTFSDNAQRSNRKNNTKQEKRQKQKPRESFGGENVANAMRSNVQTCWTHSVGNERPNKKQTASLPSWWRSEPNVDRVANGISGRVDRLKSLGNAIVPQVAFQIFKGIVEQERKLNEQKLYQN